MTIFRSFTLSLALLGSGTLALADGGKPTALPPKMAQECAACHIAFRPNFLPTSSWKQVMESLDQHYGADAAKGDFNEHKIRIPR